MSDSLEAYYPVGVVYPTEDAPGLGTPVFRNENGDRYFIQSFLNRHRIESFEFIGGNVEGREQVLTNSPVCVGSPVQIGLRFPDGSIKIGDMNEIRVFFRDNYSAFAEYPFAFYQLAIRSRSEAAVLDALSMQPVKDAVAKRVVPVIFPRTTKRGTWSDGAVRVFKLLWDLDYSAGDIGRVLGFKRNAVVSKAKRLKLKSRRTQEGLFGDPDELFFDDDEYTSHPIEDEYTSHSIEIDKPRFA